MRNVHVTAFVLLLIPGFHSVACASGNHEKQAKFWSPTILADSLREDSVYANPQVKARIQGKMPDAHYPALARENHVSGKVVVSFIIEKNGTTSHRFVTYGKDLGYGLPEASISLVEGIKFIPAKQNGVAVRSYFDFPCNWHTQEQETQNAGY